MRLHTLALSSPWHDPNLIQVGQETKTTVGAVLYDLDGVLLNSTPLMSAVLADLATTALGREPTRAAVARVLPMPVPAALHALGVPNPQTAIDKHFDDAYARHAHLATIIPAAVAVIQELREAGIRQGIVTLQRRHRLNMLNLSALLSLVDTVVCHDDAPPKPSPVPIWRALNQLGVPVWQTWIVGDTTTDVAAGRAALIRVAGATWGYHSAAMLRRAGADLLLDHPWQIRTLADTGRHQLNQPVPTERTKHIAQ